jgi:hypothetical protein
MLIEERMIEKPDYLMFEKPLSLFIFDLCFCPSGTGRMRFEI